MAKLDQGTGVDKNICNGGEHKYLHVYIYMYRYIYIYMSTSAQIRTACIYTHTYKCTCIRAIYIYAYIALCLCYIYIYYAAQTVGFPRARLPSARPGSPRQRRSRPRRQSRLGVSSRMPIWIYIAHSFTGFRLVVSFVGSCDLRNQNKNIHTGAFKVHLQ